jgi:hypothetical protein
MTSAALHDMHAIPDGKKVGDVLPVFAGVRFEYRIGERSSVCAGCSKPFGPIRKIVKEVRIYPRSAVVPIAFAYPICGRCTGMHSRGGAEREAVLASIQAFHEGREVDQ